MRRYLCELEACTLLLCFLIILSFRSSVRALESLGAEAVSKESASENLLTLNPMEVRQEDSYMLPKSASEHETRLEPSCVLIQRESWYQLLRSMEDGST